LVGTERRSVVKETCSVARERRSSRPVPATMRR
jgi:hypothetical protein